MNDKERFKKIKDAWENGYEIVNGSCEEPQIQKDMAWLIKQAERVEELENLQPRSKINLLNTIHNLRIKQRDLKQQNKRYREALMEILSAEKDEEFNPLAYMSLEIMDIARRALEDKP